MQKSEWCGHVPPGTHVQHDSVIRPGCCHSPGDNNPQQFAVWGSLWSHIMHIAQLPRCRRRDACILNAPVHIVTVQVAIEACKQNTQQQQQQFAQSVQQVYGMPLATSGHSTRIIAAAPPLSTHQCQQGMLCWKLWRGTPHAAALSRQDSMHVLPTCLLAGPTIRDSGVHLRATLCMPLSQWWCLFGLARQQQKAACVIHCRGKVASMPVKLFLHCHSSLGLHDGLLPAGQAAAAGKSTVDFVWHCGCPGLWLPRTTAVRYRQDGQDIHLP